MVRVLVLVKDFKEKTDNRGTLNWRSFRLSSILGSIRGTPVFGNPHMLAAGFIPSTWIPQKYSFGKGTKFSIVSPHSNVLSWDVPPYSP